MMCNIANNIQNEIALQENIIIRWYQSLDNNLKVFLFFFSDGGGDGGIELSTLTHSIT